MSQFYDQASLVMVPSGYKAGKVYSQKPLSTDGELTFTRNSNATRIGPDGKLEKVRTNLLKYSQDFSNAAWGKSAGATLTHSQTDPNGGTTASRVQMPSGTSNYFFQTFSGATNGGKYTHSVYMKSNTGSTQSVRLMDSVRGVAGGVLTASVTTSWQRFNVVITTASTSAGFQIDNSGGAYNVDILIAFAQSEESDFGATPYIPTTTSARSTFAGITVDGTSVPNVPRLDYSGGASCPSLLLEPQRTNEMPNSEYLAGWTVFTNIAITQNQTTSPEGVTNGVLMARTGSGDLSGSVRYTGISTTANSKCFSIFAKANAHNFIQLYHSGDAQGYVNFDLSTGAVGTSGSKASGTIKSYGSGWYRCTAIYDNTNAFGSSYYVGFAASASSGYAGGAVPDTASVYLYAAQIESSASYATSYIPTLGASVTRLADAAYKTGISSLIGQTEGTIFVEADLSSVIDTANIRGLIELNDGTTNNRFSIYRGANTTDITALIYTVAVQKSAVVVGLSGKVKIAIGYDSSGSSFYFNGSLISTEAAMTYPACTDLDLGIITSNTNRILGDGINQALLFKTRLTNAQLAELTTL